MSTAGSGESATGAESGVATRVSTADFEGDKTNLYGANAFLGYGIDEPTRVGRFVGALLDYRVHAYKSDQSLLDSVLDTY